MAGARLGLERTPYEAVRAYAQRLVDDYGAAGERFTGLLTRYNLEATPATGARGLQDVQRATADALRGDSSIRDAVAGPVAPLVSRSSAATVSRYSRAAAS